MYLCIDSITKNAGITLANSERATPIPFDLKNASEEIIDTIDKVLKKEAVSLSNLAGILVIKGPGSFTGLRVGLTVANQFAHELKIPIVGLRTDDWWLAKMDKSDVVYIQTMNKSEVYLSSAKKVGLEDVQNLAEFGPCEWVGQLSEDHESWLPSDFKKASNFPSVEAVWQACIEQNFDEKMTRKTYSAVEPFYGKEPNITPARKKLSAL